MYFKIKLDSIGEWRWALHANNYKIIADSGEGYKNRADCVKAIRLVQASWDAEIRSEPVNALAAFAKPTLASTLLRDTRPSAARTILGERVLT